MSSSNVNLKEIPGVFLRAMGSSFNFKAAGLETCQDTIRLEAYSSELSEMLDVIYELPIDTLELEDSLVKFSVVNVPVII
jgi:hypothetical protein